MYYGENIFVSHPDIAPFYKNGCTYLFGLMLYTISKGEIITLHYGYRYGETKTMNCTVEGVIEYDFKYNNKPFGKKMTDSQHNEIVDTINALLIANIVSDKCTVNYPYESKYSILVLMNEIKKDWGNVWIKKEFTPKYGQVAFEVAMQNYIDNGYTYFTSHNGIVELVGTAYSKLYEGDVLMLIDDDVDIKPKLFSIKEIFFRQKRVSEANPAMRGYHLIMSCDCDVHINESDKLVKYT